MRAGPHYAELGARTNFSFLEGASHAEEMVQQALALGLNAIGIADRNTLAGVVRAQLGVRDTSLQLLVGARLVPEDGPPLICYPEDRDAYGRLCQLLTLGKMRAEKGACRITLADILEHADGQCLIAVPPPGVRELEAFETVLGSLAAQLPGRLYLGAQYLFNGRDKERLGLLAEMAHQRGAPMVAMQDALYHSPERRPLQDVMTCVREGCTLDEAGWRLEANAERHLKTPGEMRRLFASYPDAVDRTAEIARRCRFNLDELRYQYPGEPVPPGATPQQHLVDLTWQGARERYGDTVPPKVCAALEEEFALIEKRRYAHYFLTINDIVAWARGQGILCQGRGSAANSAVCFCLGITSVDPAQSNLLFARFLSEDRDEPPDIDVDFEHERREEVIQYIYGRYGRDRAALTATVICYRPRSAVRDVCKALGLTDDIASALAGTVWGSWGRSIRDKNIREAGLDPANPEIRRAVTLTRQLIGHPRHLSQHVGGFVLTDDLLTRTVPVGPAAMPDRTFIEWDKDDLSELGIMKVDVLALGMLTCIRKAFDLIALHKGQAHDLATITPGDAATYGMLCRGDSLGTFQVESRAQMNMLPRLRPARFYDLVIQVAIVRPGPIQGDMVHPYLRRRRSGEAIDYPKPAPEHGPPDELENILSRTLGVPLFQEQAMQISIDAAKFSSSEANGLRRAMATFRKMGTIGDYQEKMIGRMVERGYDGDFAKRCFDQIKGFGEYGFPESHAASFARLVYVSSWIKCHHPDAFCAALLNAQPMGFYAPAQIVRDAREHGVEIRPIDVNLSDWDNTLEPEPTSNGGHAVRLGLRQVDGVGEAAMEALTAARAGGYATVEALSRRSGINRRALECLAAADAFRSMGLDRRAALWAVRGLAEGRALPLFAASDADEQGRDADTALPQMPASEHVIQDYQTTRLSLKAHPVRFLRDRYRKSGFCTLDEANSRRDGAFVKTAGIVLVRQKPGSASGVVFITVEDETGVANLVIWPRVAEIFRPVIMGARILAVTGRVQTSDNVTHIIARQLADRTDDLSFLAEEAGAEALEGALARADHGKNPLPHAGEALKKRVARLRKDDPLLAALSGADEVRTPIPDESRPLPRRAAGGRHPRNARIVPRSRDFH